MVAMVGSTVVVTTASPRSTIWGNWTGVTSGCSVGNAVKRPCVLANFEDRLAKAVDPSMWTIDMSKVGPVLLTVVSSFTATADGSTSSMVSCPAGAGSDASIVTDTSGIPSTAHLSISTLSVGSGSSDVVSTVVRAETVGPEREVLTAVVSTTRCAIITGGFSVSGGGVSTSRCCHDCCNVVV